MDTTRIDKLVSQKAKQYKCTSNLYLCMFWLCEVCSFVFLLLTPILLIYSQSQQNNLTTNHPDKNKLGESVPVYSAPKQMKVEGKNISKNQTSTDFEKNTIGSQVSFGCEEIIKRTSGLFKLLVIDNPSSSAAMTSVAGIIANLAKKYGWKKHIIYNDRTSKAIEFELNQWNTEGLVDEQSIRDLLKNVYDIEKKHLDVWEKDINEPEV